MQKLKFINALNQELKFDSSAPFVFWKISGVEMPSVETIYTQSAGQHGYSLHSIVLPSRIIKITGHVHGTEGDTHMYSLRKWATTVCSPLLGNGILKYENNAGKWQIPAFCKAFSYGDKCRGIQTIDITFECPSPFWTSEDAEIIRLAYVEGGAQFPLEFPTYFGTLGYWATIYNEGNTPLPIKLTIGGGALNPVIRNDTTGQKIQINRLFSESDKLYIDTNPDNITVQLISTDPVTNDLKYENAFGYLTSDSELFMLTPGSSDILFISDDDNRKVSVEIELRQRYSGV